MAKKKLERVGQRRFNFVTLDLFCDCDTFVETSEAWGQISKRTRLWRAVRDHLLSWSLWAVVLWYKATQIDWLTDEWNWFPAVVQISTWDEGPCMTGLWLGFSSVLLTASSHGKTTVSSLPNNFPKASLPSNHTSGVRLSIGEVKLALKLSQSIVSLFSRL